MAINPNTNFTAGAILTAAQQNRFPRGIMGYVSRTTGLTGITGGPTDLTGMSITFTAVADRLYKATWTVHGSKSASGLDISRVTFTNSSNTIFGTISVSSPSGNYNLNLCGQTVFTVAAGSVTYKLRMESYSGTFTPEASATSPCILIIEDLGPA